MRFRLLLVVAVGVASLTRGTSGAQDTPQDKRLATIRETLADVQAFSERLSEDDRKLFSNGAQNLFHVARKWPAIEQRLRDGGMNPSGLKAMAPVEDLGVAGASSNRVSNPATDFILSQASGFTQSETSTAWCGNNVVVGFNDSGSLLESLVLGSGGLSFNGVARSVNRGASFTDLLFLNPGPSTNFLGGDPVVACTSPTTFYYSGLLSRPGSSGISVSKSTNGGLTWGTPIAAALKPAPAHFLDKSWMTVDPTDANRIFVTYTDFDNSGTSAGCPGAGRVAIELVRSTTGGQPGTSRSSSTKSAEAQRSAFPSCRARRRPSDPTVRFTWRGSATTTSTPPASTTPSTWRFRNRKSLDHGITFAAFTKVADVFPVGDSFALRGGFRTSSTFREWPSTGPPPRRAATFTWPSTTEAPSSRPILDRTLVSTDSLMRW